MTCPNCRKELDRVVKTAKGRMFLIVMYRCVTPGCGYIYAHRTDNENGVGPGAA